MSNKIQELASQAKSQVPEGLDVTTWIETYNEKLSKLIIFECIKIMHEQERIPAGFYYAKSASAHALGFKKHFGVE